MHLKTPKRKNTRLKGFDYTGSQYYFITACAQNHQKLFGMIQQDNDNGCMVLNRYGTIAKEHIQRIPMRHNGVYLNHYVIMPNHIHMIIELDNRTTISLSTIVGLLKSGISREIGFSVWQRSFHDHIIRNETDYKNIWNYIENNPAKWAMDKYYN